MQRRNFVRTLLAAGGAGYLPNAFGKSTEDLSKKEMNHKPNKKITPLAITMWDFSWLERRWPGAGYEDWDKALSELAARGYNAVRIDAYPHLLAADAHKVWELLPEWSVQDWGAPARCQVQVMDNLVAFIQKCKKYKIKVALSTWFREDIDNIRMKLTTSAAHVEIWKKTIDIIKAADLLDTIVYVDFNNEFPYWCKFLPENTVRNTPESFFWMRQIADDFRKHYPDLPVTFSFAGEFDKWQTEDVGMHDFLELHLWMANYSEFYKEINYNYERFDVKGYDRVQLLAEKLYRSKPAYWLGKLKEGITLFTDWSKKTNKPVVTTECWGIVDYKDFPMLNWEWVKELCEFGATTAAASGRWVAIATSNFCGPQFEGMWRDVAWHKKLTNIIKTSDIDKSLHGNKLTQRLTLY